MSRQDVAAIFSKWGDESWSRADFVIWWMGRRDKVEQKKGETGAEFEGEGVSHKQMLRRDEFTEKREDVVSRVARLLLNNSAIVCCVSKRRITAVVQETCCSFMNSWYAVQYPEESNSRWCWCWGVGNNFNRAGVKPPHPPKWSTDPTQPGISECHHTLAWEERTLFYTMKRLSPLTTFASRISARHYT